MGFAVIAQWHNTAININDREYEGFVLFEDEGSYVSKPHPDITIKSCVIQPDRWLKVDLLDEDYSWLWTAKLEWSLLQEIQENLINEFWERKNENESA